MIFVFTLKFLWKDEREDDGGYEPRSPRSHIPRNSIRRIARHSHRNCARSKVCDDEPGNEAGEEADPGGEQDSERGHPRPEEDEANGDASATNDYAKDGEKPGEIYGGYVKYTAKAIVCG
jgi:hypothetical protein